MPIITPEHAGEIRGQLCEQYGGTWLHHYHESIEQAVLQGLQATQSAEDAFHRVTVQQRDSAWREIEALRDTLRHIADLAHNASTGPAVPDTLWEIRNIAQQAL